MKVTFGLLRRDAPNAMVCSVDHLASQAGVTMLRGGGSAADAAVAASAVLAVTTQHMCGLGGDLFALVHHTNGEAPSALNASGRAGSGADPDRLRAQGHRVMPFRDDIRSTPVPGCVDGWLALLERYGRLPIAEVLAPAIDLAAKGFPASPQLAAAIPAIAGVVGNDDYVRRPVESGTRITRPGVARSLRAIVEGGRAAWYEGEFGAGLVRVGNGEYSAQDLRHPLADWVEPAVINAWGHQLWSIPPNSQGYLTLASAWIADYIGLPGDPDDPLWCHLLIEAARAAGFDRLAALHEHADWRGLLAPERLKARADVVRRDRVANWGDSYGGGGTIYLCAVDADRMGVSLIQSNASGFGVHLTVPEVGVFLHNRGLGFSLEAGHPAEYGPGRRPPHTLCPVLVQTGTGDLTAVIGTMGGDGQPQVMLQLLARLLQQGQDVGQVIAGPRWTLENAKRTGFNTWDTPNDLTVTLEDDAPPGWASGLTERGHRLEVRRNWNWGHAHVIKVTDEGTLSGAADPRCLTGSATGY